MALPLYQSFDPQGCISMVTPYAGPSLTQLRTGPWSKLSSDELVVKCRRLAACGATTLTLLEDVPAHHGGRKLHRDIKPDNYCYHEKTDLFLLIDFGGLCSANKKDWFSMQDWRYVDAHLAALDAQGMPALFSSEGQRHHTHPSMDLYMLALTVVYLYLGKLPDDINLMLYDDHNMAKYVAAVRDFSWEECEELKSMPPDMRHWLLLLLAKDPSKRPQSAKKALGHRWLAEEAELVDDVVDEAVKDWEDLHAAIAEALCPAENRGCSSSIVAGACSSSPSTASVSDVAVLLSSNSGSSSEGRVTSVSGLQQLGQVQSTLVEHDSGNASLIPAAASFEDQPCSSSSSSSSDRLEQLMLNRASCSGCESSGVQSLPQHREGSSSCHPAGSCSVVAAEATSPGQIASSAVSGDHSSECISLAKACSLLAGLICSSLASNEQQQQVHCAVLSQLLPQLLPHCSHGSDVVISHGCCSDRWGVSSSSNHSSICWSAEALLQQWSASSTTNHPATACLALPLQQQQQALICGAPAPLVPSPSSSHGSIEVSPVHVVCCSMPCEEHSDAAAVAGSSDGGSRNKNILATPACRRALTCLIHKARHVRRRINSIFKRFVRQ